MVCSTCMCKENADGLVEVGPELFVLLQKRRMRVKFLWDRLSAL